MLKTLKLKFGSSSGEPPLSLDLEPSVTILIGPNNSGKSLLLREITEYCANGQKNTNFQILSEISFQEHNEQSALDELKKISTQPNPGEMISEGNVVVQTDRAGRQQYNRSAFINALMSPNNKPHQTASWYIANYTLNLDGHSRLNLLNSHARGDLLSTPGGPLGKLFLDDDRRSLFRSIIHKSLGVYVGIDALSSTNISIKFGATEPPNERRLEDENISWLKYSKDASSVSDGIRAYTGILLQIYAGDPKVIIIDEPEAFLHPSLAHRLGGELARAAFDNKKQLFVATHSPQFLMGALQSGAKINIIRLTYSPSGATARLMPSSQLDTLMTNPLLRSVGVLAGLFYENVIVTEADVDRAFYEEVNNRLVTANDPRAINHALFLIADNHQTIPLIVEPLRKLGIPTAGIPDIDVIKRGGTEWTRQLAAAGIPSTQHTSLQNLRDSVHKTLLDTAPADQKPENYFKTHRGVELLADSDLEAANNLFDQLDEYGLFIVRTGEVESWLPHLRVPSKSNGWRSAIFQAMGSDPTSAAYVKPAPGDVWDFIGKINTWLSMPSRKGIPR